MSNPGYYSYRMRKLCEDKTARGEAPIDVSSLQTELLPIVDSFVNRQGLFSLTEQRRRADAFAALSSEPEAENSHPLWGVGLDSANSNDRKEVGNFHADSKTKALAMKLSRWCHTPPSGSNLQVTPQKLSYLPRQGGLG